MVWLSDVPVFSIILIVSWQWLPFATLILLTAIQSLDSEQLEAAEMDGAPPLKRFFYIILPHLSRAITIVILIQTIFLLSIFAEIFVTTGGAFGTYAMTVNPVTVGPDDTVLVQGTGGVSTPVCSRTSGAAFCRHAL